MKNLKKFLLYVTMVAYLSANVYAVFFLVPGLLSARSDLSVFCGWGILVAVIAQLAVVVPMALNKFVLDKGNVQ
jgi:hypothetical protein